MKIKFGKTNRGETIVQIIFILLMVAIPSGLIGASIAIESMKKKAVEHKAAHYELNPSNGTSTWHWNQ